MTKPEALRFIEALFHAPCDECGNLFFDDEQIVYRDKNKWHASCFFGIIDEDTKDEYNRES